MRKLFILLAMAIFLMSLVLPDISSAFHINVTSKDVRKATSVYIVGDLKVGEEAYVPFLIFHKYKGKVYLSLDEKIGPEQDYRTSYIVKKIPGNKVEVMLEPESDSSISEAIKDVLEWFDSNGDIFLFDRPDLDFSKVIEVKSIQGTTSVQDLIVLYISEKKSGR